jgi:ClpP class serine protease
MRDNWLIEAQAAEAHLPLLQSWLDQAQLHRDEEGGADEAKQLDPLFGCFAAQLTGSDATMYKSFDEAPSGSTAILDISGPILKDDFCDIGMQGKAEQIRTAYKHPNINSLLIKFDTPGGQSNAPALAADAIREARAAGVPVLGWVDHGTAASAGMWIFAACTEGWLSQPTDAVGSIGGYQRIRKNASTDVLEVYAPQSKQKNLSYRKAANGDTSLLEAELAETVDVFIASVKADRGDRLRAGTDAFEGGMFMGQKAVTEGLADGICTFAQAVARVQALAAEAAAPAPGTPTPAAAPPQFSTEDTLKPILSVKYAVLCAALGATTGLAVDKEKGTYLNEAQLDALETHLTTAGTSATELTAAKADLTTANNTAAAEKKRADDAEAQLSTYANLPGKELNAPQQTGQDRQLEVPKADEDPFLAQVLGWKQEMGIPNE